MVHCLRRPSDFLGRYGGEEFVAVLPGTTRRARRSSRNACARPSRRSRSARRVAVRARRHDQRRLRGRVGTLRAEQLVAAADAALLAAKRAAATASSATPRRSTRSRCPRIAGDGSRRSSPIRGSPIVSRVSSPRRAPPRCSSRGRRRALAAARTLAPARATTASISSPPRRSARSRRAYRRDRRRGDLAREVIDYVDHVQVVYRRRGDDEIEPPARDDH